MIGQDTLCCENCFSDFVLKRYIKENGQQGSCSFCGSSSVSCLPPGSLESFFIPLLGLYVPAEDVMPTELLKEYDGSFFWERLTEEWVIFSDEVVEQADDLLKEILASLSDETSYFRFLDVWVVEACELDEDVKRERN